MHLQRSTELVESLRLLDAAGSTNDVLAELVAKGDEPDFSTVATLNQTGGRGRLGRVWVAPADKTLAVSVLLRPVLPDRRPLGLEHFGWFPLIAGVAMAVSVDALVGAQDGAQDRVRRTGLKWPNDVQIDGRKVCGVLAELLPAGGAVIIGTGVNLTLDESELPVPTATSLALAGVAARGTELVDLLLGGYLAKLRELVGRFVEARADPVAGGIHDLVSEWCSTLGQEVRVQLPSGHDLVGVATGIDETGRLVVRPTDDGSPGAASRGDAAEQAVAAGDVTHLRYE
jgi:BirA family biotin operon repressor/biotin-[acetyl-CoA-carboxylase] ligase